MMVRVLFVLSLFIGSACAGNRLDRPLVKVMVQAVPMPICVDLPKHAETGDLCITPDGSVWIAIMGVWYRQGMLAVVPMLSDPAEFDEEGNFIPDGGRYIPIPNKIDWDVFVPSELRGLRR